MTKKELTDIIEQGEALGLISTAYTEIATARLKRIRQMVLQNRLFLADLSNIFLDVKQVAIQRKIASALAKKPKQTISIIITSNYHFYGSVNVDLIKFFLHMDQAQSDLIIIGQTAINYLKDIKYTKPYQTLNLKKDYPDLSELNFLVEKVKDYNRILIFFSTMKSVMIQKPTVLDITESSYLKFPTEQLKGKDPLFIFEPELEKILLFFENQVKNLLLQQTFLESELSRTASRLVSMDNAQNNAEDFIKNYKILLNSVNRSIQNNKILETYNAIRKQNA